MKQSTFIFFALAAVLLAASATAWPHPHPRPHPHPHPHFPYPKGHAFPPLPPLPPLPSQDAVTKCRAAVRDSGAVSCAPLSFDAEKCCTYLTSLEDACSFVPYYQGQLFKGIVARVCPADASPSPPA